MPEMFAGVLDPGHQGRILERLALFWVAVTDVAAMGRGMRGSFGRRSIGSLGPCASTRCA